MDNCNINLLPEKIEQKLMTVESASKLLMKELYTRPYRYGLYHMNPDDRSDFILHIFPRFYRLFKKYKKETAPFIVYFYSYVTGALYSWRRQKSRQRYADKSMAGTYIQMLEENTDLYNQNEFSENPAQKKTPHFAAQTVPPFTCNPQSELYPSAIKDCFSWKHKTIRAKTILVLALKASYYLHDTEITKISKTCDCNNVVLQNTIHSLQTTLSTKAIRREDFKRKRDNAYYFHRKYMQEIFCLSPDSSRYKIVQAKYRKHTACWHMKNNLLKQNRYRVCPTNALIAKILGICERQVSFYITTAKKREHPLAEDSEGVD